jgi:hypothetical protein
MAHRSSLVAAPAVLYLVGLVVLFVGLVPLLRKNGASLHVAMTLVGASLVLVGIVLAARANRSGSRPGG